MKRNHEGCIRGFYRCSKAWYADKNRDTEIAIGMYDPEGGTSGEFSVKWSELGSRIVMQLRAYDDSWSALACFADLLAGMANMDSDKISEPEFANFLTAIGVKDLTPYNRNEKR